MDFIYNGNITIQGILRIYGGCVKVIDNNNEHSMTADFPDGSLFIRALAANPESDFLNSCMSKYAFIADV